MIYQTLQWSVNDGILTLTLNRPERLNAFTVRMADELVDAFGRASHDDGVRAIVVTGAGRAFCAGMDLAESGNVFGLDESLAPTMRDLHERLDDPEIVAGVRDTGGRVALAIFDCTKPVIAAVNGAAVGVGATMTLAMDIRLASEHGRFGFVFGKIGIVPDACSSWFLPKIVGLAKALKWTYSGEILTSSAALAGGLVEEVLPAAELLPRAYAIARMLATERSPASTAYIRQMMYRNSGLPHPLHAHKVESLALFEVSTRDGKEGVAAFREKRTPSFRESAPRLEAIAQWWDETPRAS
ncbi:crotonase/enoyl-CoA hydratase family protein [Verminephrobacter eiseniae]|uniref:crotonase/enoyl-CoA hydratase family protein n=1 Tax=Verminephrobacter eiseniae TaxID=364317 RepID=UPI0022388C2F|nr:crotonase/enoyl-CoA hydratase family protein [Verminephrobacter eiseniae]MCW5233483.1 enoyl-CoA hydratase [Verminephrobacter eiseniae]MCW5261637.1 enoyl-CoA hydratase [Verminephrobacter eiseniae]MCW5294964.1 enoyl-CoA hydratase [Verminephrobacter eiseniae]MCW8184242.1 enoyl-CoA hydratase [Verminephrobacter eiseniae]MCW8222779.1 enoyl-CoA hydratase [Verminephrobacter eiseniae]